jgi:DNA-binding CsgD family transcriptional regulator
MKKEELEGFLAEGLSLEQIGKRVGRSPSTISYHLKKHGLRPVNHGRHANRGPVPAPDLARLIEDGLSLREMAERLDRGPSTIRYWIGRHGLKTRGMGLRKPGLSEAKEKGVRYVESRCEHHGLTRFILENRGYYRCMQCRMERVSAWRRRAKRRLLEAAGGACALCGYDRSPVALQFHHLDPSQKEFSISREGVTRSFAELEAEAAKCVLLCANCHAEIEHGYASLPSQSQLSSPGRIRTATT